MLEACDDAPAAPGELVACAGAGLASHAEVVSVPRTLCARVPEGVPAEDAAYATVAAIALHGVRLTEAGLGDVAAVIGLGLVGQLAVELLAAAGCVVLGVDPDPARVELARDGGRLRHHRRRRAGGRGRAPHGRPRRRRASLVCAAASSSAPLATATAVARERATVCVVGDVAIESPRAPLFAKELRLVVSRSYGPGRYDPTYEEGGIDYPAGYVRWTEGRNLEEVLRLMAGGQLRPVAADEPHLRPRRRRGRLRAARRPEPSLGILLRYPGLDDAGPVERAPAGAPAPPRPRAAGCASASSAPARSPAACCCRSSQRHADVVAVATATGVSARGVAERVGATLATTDAGEVLESPDVDAVLIATRHDTHARLRRARAAGRQARVRREAAGARRGGARRRRGRARGGRRRPAWSASTAASRRSPSRCARRSAGAGRS